MVQSPITSGTSVIHWVKELCNIGKEEVQKGELIKFFESSFLEHGLNFSVGVIYGPQNQCPDLLKLPSLVRR